MKASVLRGMELISSHTCIQFSRQPSKYMIKIGTVKGQCRAAIGKIYQPSQEFTFSSSCYTAGSAAHELIHALGFYHAHQRLDRDIYLKFNLQEWRMENSFQKQQYKKYGDQLLLVPYDYGSVMQYHDTDEEYLPRDPKYFRTMGSEIVSFYDYYMININYECSCDDDDWLECENLGYRNPASCDECVCPYGFGGRNCSQRAEPGETLEASEAWRNTTVTLDAGYTKLLDGRKYRQNDYSYHYLWITAPTNKTIEVEIHNFNGVNCEHGCKSGGVEVKTHEDPRMTSPRACCMNETEIYRSRNNPTIVMFFNLEGLDEYNLSYRFT
ncbi:hypothetical protein GCK72_016758 [Caenorhabditis remanei]|uniref:Zinc metalloproteinase n=1 Tax=Caenorhabditis remanei TaxID=31234 RepID=A0A6A5G684_CAERE|nr:hypothetical protein GCK72_016758 [Caenorhabditis remanei]KAF1750211.1 hypothetical protein GCK72_016758 [Caenorhabditis remanei]